MNNFGDIDMAVTVDIHYRFNPDGIQSCRRLQCDYGFGMSLD